MPAPQPPPQAAPQGPPSQMQLPGQSGIMGFLGNPMVQGALTGYLNAIRTPRYQGRGALMANAGLGFLSGMSGAEQALTQQQKDALEMEKERQNVDKERKYNESVDRIASGTGTDGDRARVYGYEYLKHQQDQKDIQTVNQTNAASFVLSHPNDKQAAIIAGAVAKNSQGVVTLETMDQNWQQLVKDPTLAESTQLSLQQQRDTIKGTEASTASTKASTARTEAEIPGTKAESAQKQRESDIFLHGTADMTPQQLQEEQRQKVFGHGKAVTWVDRDPKTGEIYGYVPGSADSPPGYAAKGQWVESGAMGQIGREVRAGEKEHAQWMQSKTDPSDIYMIDLNKGEKPHQPGDLPWKPGTIGKPIYKTYVDANGQHQTIDVNKEAPQRDWVPYSTGAVGAPLAEEKAEATLTKQILGEFAAQHPRPFGSSLTGVPGVGQIFSPDVAKWYEDARQYGITKYNGFDIKTGQYPGKRKPGATSTPEGTPTATPTTTASSKPDIVYEWRRYQALHPGAQQIIKTDPDGTVHHGGRATGEKDVYWD
jgi:hypothetical protein